MVFAATSTTEGLSVRQLLCGGGRGTVQVLQLKEKRGQELTGWAIG